MNVTVCLGLPLPGGFLVCSDQTLSLLVSVRPRMMSVNGPDDASWLKSVVWGIVLDPEEWLKKSDSVVSAMAAAAALLSFSLTRRRKPNRWALPSKI